MTDIQRVEPTSIFEIRDMASIYAEIRDVYLSNNMPWVIGYSGGKDSTVSLQLIWIALRELPPEQLTKPIYVIATDTLVETPVIVDHVTGNLGKIGKAAQAQGLPITVHRLTPEVTDSFWVNMIGRGYPAPHSKFRWCTERMKIKPSARCLPRRSACKSSPICSWQACASASMGWNSTDTQPSDCRTT